MANTYTLIASNTLSSSAASVTFSSIPATYTDLVLRVSARGNGTGSRLPLRIQLNGDTATNYSTTNLIGTGTTASSDRSTSVTVLPNTDALNDGGTTANTFGSFELYIPNYTVTQNKPISLSAVVENNATTSGDWQVGGHASLWRNTATVNQVSISLAIYGLAFVSGSSFFLYGIKNS